jgi:hypothetical protein
MLAEAYSPRVLEFLGAEEGAEATASDVATGLDIAYEVARACLSFLYKSGSIVRGGSGKKGQPFRYSISVPNGHTDIPKRPDADFGDTGRFGFKD